ncbi:TonB-dependent receptor [Labilibacter sediminis]|nr:TonB-dependent receptor [Labilibacter sediminis]
MKKTILLFVLIVSAISIWAQDIPITGIVTEASTGELLPGVNVYIEGTTTGTITDMNGAYNITAPNGATLVFSFIGFEDQKIVLAGHRKIDVSLTPNMETLDEVIAVGYGYTKKSDLTGAVASISENMMKQTTNTNITEGLQGRIAGVQVTSAEGSPGGGLNFQIRGASSLNANSQPLYVIDGIPVEVQSLGIDDGISGPSESPINNINPNNIESIEILKDASATAIYGSRGANGVVMITTKTGKKGKAVVNIDASHGVQQVTKSLDVLNSQEYAQFMYGRTSDGIYADWRSYRDSTNTDWQKEMFDLGRIQNYNISISGGSDETTYMVSAGYFRHDGVVSQKSTFERYTSDVNLNQKLNAKASVNFKLSVGHTINNGVATGGNSTPKNAGLIRQILRSPPTRDIDYDAESLADDVGNLNQLDNPANFADNVTNLNNTTRILGKAEFKYKIRKNLLFTSRLGTNYNAVKYEKFYPKESGRGRNVGGLSIVGHNQRRSFAFENFVNYNTKIDQHKIALMGGATAEKTFLGRFETQNQDFAYSTLGTGNIGVGTDPQIPSSASEENQLASFFGRIQYNFDERYLVTASFRADGSSRFPQNKWGYFPSASAAWRVSQEKFFEPLTNVVSNFKLRASYGETGNQNIPNYISFARMDIANYPINGTTLAGLSNGTVGNPDLKWETTTSQDFGLELGFLQNRIALTTDYYIKKTSDMLLSVPVPSTSGYKNYLKNIGSMENRGWEFSLSSTNIKTNNFTWTSNFNITFNRNKVTALGVDQTYFPVASGNNQIDGKARVIVGQPIGIWWGFETDGIYKTQEELDALPNDLGHGIGDWRIKDIAGAFDENGNPIPDGKVDLENDRKIIGKAEPIHFGGFVNNFKYKNFSLDVFLSWSYGGDIFNANKWDLTDMTNTSLNRFTSVLDAWVPEDIIHVNEETGEETLVIPANTDSNKPGYGTYNRYFVDEFIEDGSYLRLKTVTIGYDLNSSLTERIGLRSVRVFARGENLYTWTNYSGYDPEVDMSIGTNGLAPGIDYGAYPRARTITLGVNVKL